MGGLSKWIKIIRPNNLIIVAAAQFLFQHTIIMRIYAPRDIVLCGIHFYLFILCTLIIAGSGYIINDIFDRQEDAINKPEKFYLLNKNDIRKAYIYYVLLVISGACIAIYLGFKVNLLTSVWIYFMFQFILFIYARYLKNTVLVGNILVSILISLSFLILFLPQMLLGMTPYSYSNTQQIIILAVFYSLFAFMINLAREIIKDAEDVEGDAYINLTTIATRYGMIACKQVVFYITLIALVLLLAFRFLYYLEASFQFEVLYYLFLGAPLLFTVTLIHQAKIKKDFSRISFLLKFVILIGLVSMFIFL